MLLYQRKPLKPEQHACYFLNGISITLKWWLIFLLEILELKQYQVRE